MRRTIGARVVYEARAVRQLDAAARQHNATAAAAPAAAAMPTLPDARGLAGGASFLLALAAGGAALVFAGISLIEVSVRRTGFTRRLFGVVAA